MSSDLSALDTYLLTWGLSVNPKITIQLVQTASEFQGSTYPPHQTRELQAHSAMGFGDMNLSPVLLAQHVRQCSSGLFRSLVA